MKLNTNDVLVLYKKTKTFAQKQYVNGEFENALKSISFAANVAYLFNFIYKDDELENLLFSISSKVIEPKLLNEQNTNRYVMIDEFATPNKGLTQQYLRGLISMDVEFLYISLSFDESKEKVYKEVENSSKGMLQIVPEGNLISKINYIYNLITNYHPNSILAHISPGNTLVTTILYALSGIKRYNINLTDHAFWLGAGCFDYTFEFREFGCNVSTDKRGFKSNQVLRNLFYPIIDDTDFKGFPKAVKGKVILFSGGNYYKIYGNNNKYLYLIKNILEQNPNLVFLFAGTGINKKPIERFIIENQLSDRFLLIGERSDINQVFLHCDIYLSTYPLGGGLMNQYAAYNGKPIVAFMDEYNANSQLDDLIFENNSKELTFTYTTEKDFFNEINRLIRDESYRKNKGEDLKVALKTKDDFDSTFKSYLLDNKTCKFNTVVVDYENQYKLYFDQNKYIIELGISLFKNFKLYSLLHFPKISLIYMPKVLSFIVRINYNKMLKK